MLLMMLLLMMLVLCSPMAEASSARGLSLRVFCVLYSVRMYARVRILTDTWMCGCVCDCALLVGSLCA